MWSGGDGMIPILRCAIREERAQECIYEGLQGDCPVHTYAYH